MRRIRIVELPKHPRLVRNKEIWTNRYIVGSGWGTATMLSENAAAAQIAMDATGNAIAVWAQDGYRNLWSNRYSRAGGWGTAIRISSENATAANPHPTVAIDATGNAIAIWTSGSHVWSNRYSLDSGWSTPTPVEDVPAGGASSPQITLDANGNGFALWIQSDGTGDSVWARRYVAGTGWQPSASLETDSAGDASAPRIAVDVNGNALALWAQNDRVGRTHVWAKRYSTGSGWGEFMLVAPRIACTCKPTFWVLNPIDTPQLAMSASGAAIALWRDAESSHLQVKQID
jgi:hypothetical protein